MIYKHVSVFHPFLVFTLTFLGRKIYQEESIDDSNNFLILNSFYFLFSEGFNFKLNDLWIIFLK